MFPVNVFSDNRDPNQIRGLISESVSADVLNFKQPEDGDDHDGMVDRWWCSK